ncbi:hypothetical protein [Streptodolium elevatio]|uniref:Lipoprotein n=1 Tax=Streptodolium elevatio TaxID=3157996 RepID=A0ABV3DVW5_9ACTN
MDPKAIAEQAIAHTKENRTVAVTGTGTDEQGAAQESQACMAISPDGNTSSMKGTTKVDGVSAEVIGTGGKSYVKAPGMFYAREAGATDPASVAAFDRAVGGKYVVGDDEGSQDSADFFDGKTDGLVKGEVTDFHGKKAVPLSWTDADGTRKTVYVAAKGDPAVVGQLEENGPARVESEVTGYGVPCDVAAPPADQVITQEQARQAVAAQA